MRRNVYRRSRLRQERKNKRKILFIVAIIALLGVGAFFARAPQFHIAAIHVEGAQSIPSSLIQTLAQKELDGSYFFLFPKNNILWFPKDGIAKQIAQTLPSVKTVSVSPKLPNDITIHIEEYTPQAIICGNYTDDSVTSSLERTEECFLLDNGFAFATTSSARRASLAGKIFEIRQAVPSELTLRKKIISASQFSFLSDLSQSLAENRIIVDFIMVEKSGDITAQTKEGAELYFSNAMPIADAIKNLNTLLLSDIFKKEGLAPPEGFSKIDYIDVRFGNKLYYKVNTGEPQQHETDL